MEFLKKFWNWLLGQTTIDEKVEAKVAKIEKEVIEVVEAAKVVAKEAKDVVAEVKPRKKRTSKPKADQ